jgi:dihydroxy-acid dehydratase
MADAAFRDATSPLRAKFGITGPGRKIIIDFSSGSMEMREGNERTDAGISITEDGFEKLTRGSRPPMLLLTRKLKLEGDFMRYSSYLGTIMKILDVLQGKIVLPDEMPVPSSSLLKEAETTLREPTNVPVVEGSPPYQGEVRGGFERARQQPPPGPLLGKEAVHWPNIPTPQANAPAHQLKPNSRNLFEDSTLPIGIVRLSILRGLGIDPDDLRSRPFIGIANSWVEMNPGHKHLRQLADEVKAGVLMAGGLPFEFNVPAPCDGVGNGNSGMRFVLAQRDLIADVIECYARSHWFDGIVTLSSCDKINPGMLMAAARLDVPTICVTGGSNAWNIRFAKRRYTSVDHKDYEDFEDKLNTATCATCGSCEIMGTANTIQCLMEVLGMALPGSGAVPAFLSEKTRFARAAGKRIVELVKADLRPSQILTRKAFENAVMADLAIGGSTNSTLHLPAIAAEAGIELPLGIFNELNRKVPTLCGISPNGPYGMLDFYTAGGVPAVLKQLRDVIHRDCITVAGITIGEVIERAWVADSEVIRPTSNPYKAEGGTAVLYGNLAPDGCVVKQSSVAESMHRFTGEAVCFDSEQEALEGLAQDRVKPGSVVVIRYEGPKGAPGMPELLSVTAILDAVKMERVALVTDGRFSGATHGPCIGHVSPEASDGGPIALVRNGDRIQIDLPARAITLHVSEAELAARKVGWQPVVHPVARGYMDRYRHWVSSAATGARVNRTPEKMQELRSGVRSR